MTGIQSITRHSLEIETYWAYLNTEAASKVICKFFSGHESGWDMRVYFARDGYITFSATLISRDIKSNKGD